MRISSTYSYSLVFAFFIALAAVLFAGHGAFAEEGFDCPAMCEEGTKQALDQCRKNHPKDPAACPADDGRIPDECRRVCAELSGKSLEELQKMLPPNYQDILQGK
ncbi:MAG: hypothetical protein HZA03_04655 [Nitrospinae bacterium]|nr:hypothetical protein [Nitrospinota bacterium]